MAGERHDRGMGAACYVCESALSHPGQRGLNPKDAAVSTLSFLMQSLKKRRKEINSSKLLPQFTAYPLSTLHFFPFDKHQHCTGLLPGSKHIQRKSIHAFQFMSTYEHFEPQLREFDKNKYLHAYKHFKRRLAKQ